MPRHFWVTDNPRREPFRRAHVTAISKGLTPVQPRPDLGPFPFTGEGVDALTRAVGAKWGTTPAEYAADDALRLLNRLTNRLND